MRCLTLADELQQRGAEVTFVCREHPGHLISIIEGKGFPVVRLQQEGEYGATTDDVAHAVWLGVSWQQDAAETIAAVKNGSAQWLIVDHYALDRRWEMALRPHIDQIMVIDDLADRPHDCELLLDQNLSPAMETRYENLLPGECKKLYGPKYALLRPEFAKVRKALPQRDGQIRRVLVFFGGIDSTNETAKALQTLAVIDDRQFEVDVVVGAGSQHKEQIKNLCAEHAGFHYHCQINNMAELMTAADLAIGAGGTATWERCAAGIPAIIMAVADNQRELAETGARNGLFFYLGEARAVSAQKLLTALQFCLDSKEMLRFYTENCLETVDAKGVRRVANLLMPPQVTIRRAILDDCDAIYEWRNAEETRRYIFNAEPIPLDVHRSWYCRALENPERILLVGEIGSKAVGVLRFDLSGEEALISVYLVPGGQGQGVGSQLIHCGSQWLRNNHSQIKIINAEIFKENVGSLLAFEAAGYKEHHRILQKAL